MEDAVRIFATHGINRIERAMMDNGSFDHAEYSPPRYWSAAILHPAAHSEVQRESRALQLPAD
jgi:hypothetical protein